MADTSVPPPGSPGFSLNIMESFGTQILGSLFSIALWGVSCMQMFLYFMRYEKDFWGLKLFVVYLWLLDAVIEALTWVGLFSPLVTHWGSLQYIIEVTPAFIHRTWLGSLLAFSAQLFFMYRIYRFTELEGKGWPVRVCLGCAVLIASWQIVGAIPYSVWVLTSTEPTVIAALSVHRVLSVGFSFRAASAFTDILIATWMTVLLSGSMKRSSPFRRSNRLVHRLIFVTINSGIWTALVALIDFILMAWNYSHLEFTVFEYPLAALYLNMVLANLNVRDYLRGQGGEVYEAMLGDMSAAPRSTDSFPLRHMRQNTTTAKPDESLAIRIETSMTLKSDADSIKAGKPSL
ncbi:uncharacterized protein PHACADRAFT_199767 [Phanerochaete carnosa HHB-10118-sp]|uniref:DUF6534 domain-containing protein n=1 Tax=Phanerochaete carnosa (strain HHB-10118-sp) TaxID=650164 RepID=K5WKY8_PHACS|nr:uncharacterized protein PHACADRAFT_199767 [Phanerochaete carnosa HHB-10118-sp]EKM50927.1 hypothetical protein PHACADRAFT_199767 [Phanerochaete carnosa HHB-10118-sp]